MNVYEADLRDNLSRLHDVFLKYERLWERVNDSNVRLKLRAIRLKVGALVRCEAPTHTFLARVCQFITEDTAHIVASPTYIRTPNGVATCGEVEGDRYSVCHMFDNTLKSLDELQRAQGVAVPAALDAAVRGIRAHAVDINVGMCGDLAVSV
jgi:hypothetical protein